MTVPSQHQTTRIILVGGALLALLCGACGLGALAVGLGYFAFTQTRPVALTTPLLPHPSPTSPPPSPSPVPASTRTAPSATATPAGPRPTATLVGALPGELVIPDEGKAHAPEGAPIPYLHYPPSSGTHYPSPAPWGVYTDTVPEGTFVHNLEHGGVVILYTCSASCDDLRRQLQAFYEAAPPEPRFGEVKILITPYQRELPTPIVALAWDHELDLEKFDADLLLRWYKRFVNRCCEDVP